jgi:hypothetical protein
MRPNIKLLYQCKNQETIRYLYNIPIILTAPYRLAMCKHGKLINLVWVKEKS